MTKADSVHSTILKKKNSITCRMTDRKNNPLMHAHQWMPVKPPAELLSITA